MGVGFPLADRLTPGVPSPPSFPQITRTTNIQSDRSGENRRPYARSNAINGAAGEESLLVEAKFRSEENSLIEAFSERRVQTKFAS